MGIIKKIFRRIFGPRSKRWVSIYLCKNCKNELSEYEWSYSHGVCPRCGAVSDGTFVDADKSSRLE